MDIHFSDKIELYCKLHGNRFSVLTAAYLRNDQCEKCRKKNNGICNIRYRNHHIIYNETTDTILEIISHEKIPYNGATFDAIVQKWRVTINPKYIPSAPWGTRFTPVRNSDICFGNLYNENNDK
jgi:uncharacterized protein with NRDE domain